MYIIPKHVSDELCLREGSKVQVSLKGKIVTIKLTEEKKETLRDLVKGITKKIVIRKQIGDILLAKNYGKWCLCS